LLIGILSYNYKISWEIESDFTCLQLELVFVCNDLSLNSNWIHTLQQPTNDEVHSKSIAGLLSIFYSRYLLIGVICSINTGRKFQSLLYSVPIQYTCRCKVIHNIRMKILCSHTGQTLISLRVGFCSEYLIYTYIRT